jgi:hypothetical protein
MTKVIVTSTINAPSRAVQLFDAMPDWHLIVVGDQKTPLNYKLRRGTYLAPKDQEKYDKQLSDAIGWNRYQRLNIGLLIAKDMKADVIALVNDDNIPLPIWGKNLMLEKYVSANYYETDLPVFDPVGATVYPHLWHRGYPIELVHQRDYRQRSTKPVMAQIQADFWNGDPDTDAIARLLYKPDCSFGSSSFPIASNKPSPFNCQNTFIIPEVLNSYFLWPGLGRMDDIWASYYVQIRRGFQTIYGTPSVFHDRDPHDLIVDMKNEYLGNEVGAKIIRDLKTDSNMIQNYISKEAMYAWDLYKRHF